MKLVYCLECGDIFSPGGSVRGDGSQEDRPKRCRCGYAVAKWKDPVRGILHIASRGGASLIRVLGINNRWLEIVTSLAPEDQLHRYWNVKTSEEADGYLFKSRNCPIIMAGVNELTRSGDIIWNAELLDELEWHGKFDCMLGLPAAEALMHSRSCSQLSPGSDEDCTCGLVYRQHLQTEQTMHAALRKHASEVDERDPHLRETCSHAVADARQVLPALGLKHLEDEHTLNQLRRVWWRSLPTRGKEGRSRVVTTRK
jgi:hypothetical protein